MIYFLSFLQSLSGNPDFLWVSHIPVPYTDITFEGDIEPFIPLIKAGEILHVGKGTGFGLGKYSIQNLKFKIQESGLTESGLSIES
jgi:hypothetical protein